MEIVLTLIEKKHVSERSSLGFTPWSNLVYRPTQCGPIAVTKTRNISEWDTKNRVSRSAHPHSTCLGDEGCIQTEVSLLWK